MAGRTPAYWAPWQARFLDEEIRPRLTDAARACLARHRAAGHRLVLTTAANRLIAERTAQALGFEQMIATELELVDGLYSGRVAGEPNMREGKLLRLRAWLRQHGLDDSLLASAWFYSDSINDLPLLSAVGHPGGLQPGPGAGAPCRGTRLAGGAPDRAADGLGGRRLRARVVQVGLRSG